MIPPESNPLLDIRRRISITVRPRVTLGHGLLKRFLVGTLLKESVTGSQQLDDRCRGGIERAMSQFSLSWAQVLCISSAASEGVYPE